MTETYVERWRPHLMSMAFFRKKIHNSNINSWTKSSLQSCSERQWQWNLCTPLGFNETLCCSNTHTRLRASLLTKWPSWAASVSSVDLTCHQIKKNGSHIMQTKRQRFQQRFFNHYTDHLLNPIKTIGQVIKKNVSNEKVRAMLLIRSLTHGISISAHQDNTGQV